MSSYARALVIPATAAGGLVIGRSAKFYLIAAASENLIITGFKGSSQVIDVQGMGAGWGDWLDDGFDRLVITTASGAAGTITIALGDDFANYSTLTATVNTIDQSSPKYAAVSGRGYTCAFGAGPVAAQYARVQLRNPAGSGVNLVVTALQAFVTAAAAGAALYMNGLATAADFANAEAIAPTLIGNAVASVAKATQDTNAASIANGLGLFPLQTNIITDPDLDNMVVVVPPGYAFQIGIQTVNMAIYGMLHWEEWLTTQL